MEKPSYRAPPKHCVVPGTNFTVDWHSKTDPKFIHSFLSHAHTDHTNGIGSFRHPRVLHCTPITEKMVLLRYPKVANCIQVHEIGSSAIIENVKVYFLEANHTPGSAMFLFILPSGKKILHTGDFRAEDFIVKSIQQFAPIDSLYMDCTYGSSKLNILPRDYCIKFIYERMNAESKRNSLVLIGTYTIGKEELLIALAKANGIPIFVPESRYQSIKGLIDCNFVSSDIFTQDPTKTRLHLMPITSCSSIEAAQYARGLGYNNVICVRASGWGGKAFWQTPDISTLDEITITTYNVPYSDHSSPEQLVNFVKACKPSKVVSTTQFKTKELAILDKMFFKYIRKDTNRRFIDFYASPPRPKVANELKCQEKPFTCELSI